MVGTETRLGSIEKTAARSTEGKAGAFARQARAPDVVVGLFYLQHEQTARQSIEDSLREVAEQPQEQTDFGDTVERLEEVRCLGKALCQHDVVRHSARTCVDNLVPTGNCDAQRQNWASARRCAQVHPQKPYPEVHRQREEIESGPAKAHVEVALLGQATRRGGLTALRVHVRNSTAAAPRSPNQKQRLNKPTST